jgi:2-polyprenyl-3-methyl-5-hydroxy-6-metoxy-1,4-benzoquinol methylase
VIHPLLQRILVHPRSKVPLQRVESNRLVFDNDQTCECTNGIPVLVIPDEKSHHYLNHYEQDAVKFDYYEERDPATEHDEHRLRQTILMEVADTAQCVLDVGCGRAWVADALCSPALTVCSLDAALPNPLAASQRHSSEHHCAVVADALALPFADNSFDCVVSSEVIEHVVDPAAFVHELLRVLKPGGRCIVSTPYNEKRQFVLCIHCNTPTPLHAHLHSFTERTLTSLAPNVPLHYHVFSNKALLLLRTYVLLQFLPYPLWRMVDRVANALINKPAHIVCVWTKR